ALQGERAGELEGREHLRGALENLPLLHLFGDGSQVRLGGVLVHDTEGVRLRRGRLPRAEQRRQQDGGNRGHEAPCRARVTAWTRSEGSNGFCRQGISPSPRRRSIWGASIRPVTKIAGSTTRSARRRSTRSGPLIPGSMTSITRHRGHVS